MDSYIEFLENLQLLLADITADCRELLTKLREQPEPDTGCPRCDIEQRIHKDRTRLCPSCIEFMQNELNKEREHKKGTANG